MKIQDFDPRDDGLRNLLINGDMRIDQRFGGAAISAANTSSYGVDRWTFASTQASKFNSGQNQLGFTPPVGFQKYFNLNSISAYALLATDYFVYVQHVEGYNASHLLWGTVNANPVTLSFWVRASLTGLYGGSMKNDANTRSYVFSYTINVANTWEFKTVTVPGDVTGTWMTNNSRGIQLVFGLGVGTNASAAVGWSAGSMNSVTGAVNVAGTNGANWNITGVQLNEGRVAAPFERRSFEAEVSLCQRYYEKSYDIGVVPGTVTGAGAIVQATPQNTYFIGTTFATRKRGVPVVVYWNPTTGVSNSIRDFVVAANYGTGPHAGSEIGHAYGGGVAGNAIYYQYTADAEL